MSQYWAANWQSWVSAFCVLAVFSYLFKDNALYRIMMQIFIGVNLGYQAIVQWRDVLYPQWWLPMIDGFKALVGGPGSPWGVLWAVVGIIGLLFYLQLSRKYASFSKIAIGITVGIGAGLTFKSQLGLNIPQVVDSFKALAPSVVRPQPRVAVRLPGSDFAPAVDGALGFFVSGRQIVADELLHGVQVWSATLPSAITSGPVVVANTVVVPCGTTSVTLDRSTGRTVSIPTLLPAATQMPMSIMAKYRQPQFANGVLLKADGSVLSASATRDGVAEGIRSGAPLWSKSYSEPIVDAQSFDGVVLVAGRHESQIWDMPWPQPILTPADYVDNWVMVVTMVSVMSYFFFSFRRRGRASGVFSAAGRWMLMIGFGAFFGNTVMTRMSFLLDRLMFLIDDWLRPFWHLFFK